MAERSPLGPPAPRPHRCAKTLRAGPCRPRRRMGLAEVGGRASREGTWRDLDNCREAPSLITLSIFHLGLIRLTTPELSEGGSEALGAPAPLPACRQRRRTPSSFGEGHLFVDVYIDGASARRPTDSARPPANLRESHPPSRPARVPAFPGVAPTRGCRCRPALEAA